MKKELKRKKNHYPEELKTQAIELAKEVGTTEAAKKLGIENVQTLAS